LRVLDLPHYVIVDMGRNVLCRQVAGRNCQG
jgi:hypothetical protein